MAVHPSSLGVSAEGSVTEFTRDVAIRYDRRRPGFPGLPPGVSLGSTPREKTSGHELLITGRQIRVGLGLSSIVLDRPQIDDALTSLI